MTDRISLSGRAQCTPDVLWHVLADNRASWWPDMDFAPHPGAPLKERWSEDGVEHTATGMVLAVAPGRLLSFRWTAPEWGAHTVVSFELTDEVEATGVAVTESGFAGLDAGVGAELSAAHREGWAFHLANLIEQAEKTDQAQQAGGS